MNIIGVLIILGLGVILVAQSHGVEMNIRTPNMEFWSVIVAKVIGAASGSAIAVVFKKGGDSKEKLFHRFLIGFILGMIFAPLLRTKMGWDYSFDIWLASACVCGLLSYLVLQIILGDTGREFLASRLRSKGSR